jgi:hypothetical protein
MLLSGLETIQSGVFSDRMKCVLRITRSPKSKLMSCVILSKFPLLSKNKSKHLTTRNWNALQSVMAENIKEVRA